MSNIASLKLLENAGELCSVSFPGGASSPEAIAAATPADTPTPIKFAKKTPRDSVKKCGEGGQRLCADVTGGLGVRQGWQGRGGRVAGGWRVGRGGRGRAEESATPSRPGAPLLAQVHPFSPKSVIVVLFYIVFLVFLNMSPSKPL